MRRYYSEGIRTLAQKMATGYFKASRFFEILIVCVRVCSECSDQFVKYFMLRLPRETILNFEFRGVECK